ncbi:MAG: energy-coupling factor ABC transporter ATP-binding protein [Promethearchaeota archaeon]
MSDVEKNLTMIMVKNLDYSYPNGTVALKGINLKINKGELVGIMGKNGAGKTTLIRTLNGLIKPTRGEIFINNENTNLKSIAQLSRNIGLIFQNPSHQLFANSVEDEIKFSLKNLDMSKEELQNKVNNVLKEFDLEKYRERSPLNLSGGESKKLAIASIVCRDVEILVFDEPTLGQDAREIESFINLINEERKKNKTIIIITHNIEFTYDYIPRTILMADGQIIADGPTHHILSNDLLVNKSSLVLPQAQQISLALQDSGFKNTEKITTKNELISYITQILTNNPISEED